MADGLRWLIYLLVLCVPLQGMAAGMQRIEAAGHVHPTASPSLGAGIGMIEAPIRTLIDPRRADAGHGARRRRHGPVFVHASSLGAALHVHGSIVHRHEADDTSLVQLTDEPADPAAAVSVKRVMSDIDAPPPNGGLGLGGVSARVASPTTEPPPVAPDPERIERPPRHALR